MPVCRFTAGARTVALRRLFFLSLSLLCGAAHAQNPLPAGPAPVAWFRADALHTLADGAGVAKWPDSSGKNDAVQTEAGQQPTYAAHAFGTLPGVHFTAEKSTELALPRPVQDDFTLVCVYQSHQGTGSGAWYNGAGLLDGKSPGVVDDFGLSLSGDGSVLAGTGNPDTTVSSDGGLNDGKPHLAIFTRVRSTGAITLFVDGIQEDMIAAGTQSLTSPTRLTLGAIQTDNNYFTGDIAEVQIYSAALSEADRKALESSLKQKYGIVTTLTPRAPLKPTITVPVSERLSPVILPPDPKPAIHGPRIVGASPHRPFVFKIPATGDEPLAYACADLPAGLKLDAKTGVITGAMAAAGTYSLHLSVHNAQGTAERGLTLVCGEHTLALTPPMGWDAINIYADQMDDAKARDAADWLVKSGLAAHGYSIIHISDTWQGIREKKTGKMLPNRRRFPDMADLSVYLHGQGLKFGLYSSATEHTCTGYPGSLGYENLDALTYAAWGVDYLEYSWCPVPTLDGKRPQGDQEEAFRKMRAALDKSSRDTVYAINTFGNNNPWDWAASVGANSVVESKQIYDDWSMVASDYFTQSWVSEKSKPGRWNNPGLLMVGKFGIGNLHVSKLTPLEQMSQFSQAALLSAPLWLSCDLSSLDPNTFHRSVTAMLTNDEVLDVDQDPAGHGARQVQGDSNVQIWSKLLADGTLAVGVFNFGDTSKQFGVKLADLGKSGPQPIRDLWLHEDLGEFSGTFTTEIPRHGVVLVKIGKPKG